MRREIGLPQSPVHTRSLIRSIVVPSAAILAVVIFGQSREVSAQLLFVPYDEVGPQCPEPCIGVQTTASYSSIERPDTGSESSDGSAEIDFQAAGQLESFQTCSYFNPETQTNSSEPISYASAGSTNVSIAYSGDATKGSVRVNLSANMSATANSSGQGIVEDPCILVPTTLFNADPRIDAIARIKLYLPVDGVFTVSLSGSLAASEYVSRQIHGSASLGASNTTLGGCPSASRRIEDGSLTVGSGYSCSFSAGTHVFDASTSASGSLRAANQTISGDASGVASLSWSGEPPARISAVSRLDTPAPKNGNLVFSIPPSGIANILPSFFGVQYESPKAFIATSATVDVLDGTGQWIGSVLQAEPVQSAGSSAEHGAIQTQTGPPSGSLSLRVTFDDANPSTIETGFSPPTHTLGYRITILGELHDEDGTTSEAVLGPYVWPEDAGKPKVSALWEIPDYIPRFSPSCGSSERRSAATSTCGSVDFGGDSWATNGTHKWLSSVGVYDPLTGGFGLLPAINDISGEHGRDIGHDSHAHGMDIDTYHFSHVPAPPLYRNDVNGTLNYKRLHMWAQRSIELEPSSDEWIEATNHVTDFVIAARSGLSALLQDSRVLLIAAGKGNTRDQSGPGGLEQEWLKKLMLQGTLFGSSGQFVTILGPWTPNCSASVIDDCLRWWNGHNNHYHIQLLPEAIGNVP